MRRAVLAGLAAALLVPAGARAAAPEWYDAKPGIPQTVDLRAVALADDAVIAVGRERAAGTPALYARGASGKWAAVALDTAKGELVDVAAAGTAALAVGTAIQPDGSKAPLVLARAGGAWTAIAAPAAMKLPRAVALTVDGGAVSDASGQIFAFHDGAFEAQPLAQDGTVSRTPGPLDGLALSGARDGVAVGPKTDSTSSPFISVKSGTASQALTASSEPDGMQPVAAAIGAGLTVAVDGAKPCRETDGASTAPGLWTLGQAWTRASEPSATADSRWCDLAVTGDPSTPVVLVAGDRFDGAARVGAIWRREGTGAFARRDLLSDAGAAAPPLLGVAAAGPDDAWAVGDSGAVWRYAVPPPPPQQTTGGGSSSGGATHQTPPADSTGGGSTSTPPADPAPQPQTEPERVDVPLDEHGNASVAAPSLPANPTRPPRKTAPVQPARMLTQLVVRRQGRRLVVTFQLRAPARVIFVARRNGRVVARRSTGVLRAGRVRLRVPFRGKRPPSRLSIVVKPASKQTGPSPGDQEARSS